MICVCGTDNCDATPVLVLAHRCYLDTDWPRGVDERSGWLASLGRATKIQKALTTAGYIIARVPKDSIGRDLDMFWRIKPEHDSL